MRLQRLHYTYILRDLKTFREDYRYIYENSGGESHVCVPLLWREREVQANMYVLDAADSNLVYLPSDQVIRATQTYIERQLRRAVGEVNGPPPLSLGQSWEDAIARASRAVKKSVGFESEKEDRVSAASVARTLHDEYPASWHFARAHTFLALLRRYYLPYAILGRPLHGGEFSYVRHGVDVYSPLSPAGDIAQRFLRPSPLGRLEAVRFLMLGRLKLEVGLPFVVLRVAGATSFHCRVVVPQGLAVSGLPRFAPSRVFNEILPWELASVDERNVYMYFGQEDIDKAATNSTSELRRLRKQIRTIGQAQMEDLERNLLPYETLLSKIAPHRQEAIREYFRGAKEAAGEARERVVNVQIERAKVVPTVEISLVVSHAMAALVLLLWILTSLTVGVFLAADLTLDIFLGLMSLILTLVVSIAVFSMDKRILRDFVSTHVSLVVSLNFLAYLLESLVF